MTSLTAEAIETAARTEKPCPLGPIFRERQGSFVPPLPPRAAAKFARAVDCGYLCGSPADIRSVADFWLAWCEVADHPSIVFHEKRTYAQLTIDTLGCSYNFSAIGVSDLDALFTDVAGAGGRQYWGNGAGHILSICHHIPHAAIPDFAARLLSIVNNPVSRIPKGERA